MDPAGSGEQFVVGYRLAIKTTFGDDFEGHVLTYDKSTNIVVIPNHFDTKADDHATKRLGRIQDIGFGKAIFAKFIEVEERIPGSTSCFFWRDFMNMATENDTVGPTRRNLRFVKANYIKDYTLLGKVDEPFDFKGPHPDINYLQSREEAAVRQAELEAERIGVGVSQEAQDIFDALSKTLPVRWKETSIVVMTEVLVHSPYLPENVTGGTATANERVRKVLELERKRLQNRGSS